MTTVDIHARIPNNVGLADDRRLQRALELLRVRMKHSNGDTWQASLFALTLPTKAEIGRAHV